MKTNKYILPIFLSATLLCTFTGCEDMLNTKPKDSLTDVAYFTKPEQFQYAANQLHADVMGWRSNKGSADVSSNQIFAALFDYGSDIVAASNEAGSGTNTTPTSDIYWTQTYKWLRKVNQLIDNSQSFGSQSEIAIPVGQAYFFRAWHHFFLMKRFGGIPLSLKTPDVNDDVVWGSRKSRYEVTKQVLDDLDVAIDKLKNCTVKSTNNDGHVTLNAAKALKARVCLFEGTWEKYVDSSTDGDGVEAGAGTVKPGDYPSVESMLTMAKQLSKEVIDSGDYELWKGVESASSAANPEMYANTSYFYLFNLEDAKSNPSGLTKSSNKEAIFRSVFDYTNKQGGMNLTHSKPAGPTRKLMDMFLCKDGLPVQYSQYKLDYTTMAGEFENRDYRLTSCVKKPFNYYWGYGGNSSGCTDYKNDITQNPISSTYFYTPSLRSAGNSGYEGRKFVTEQNNRKDETESADYLQIRLAEIYLIYAEATCELGGGDISDEDLNYSVNQLRSRAGVAPLTHALIAPYSDLTLLGEIRRERALELFGEGHRINDLCRWGIAEEDMAGYPRCGIYAEYGGQPTEYATAISPMDNQPVLSNANIASTEYTVSSYKGIAKQKAGAVIIEQVSNRKFARKNYLQPIPTDEIQLNPNLKQNPNW